MGEVIILNKYDLYRLYVALIVDFCFIRVFPEWKVYSGFYTRHTESALSLDAKRSSHPIQVAVPNADDINQIFDALSYSKAASGTPLSFHELIWSVLIAKFRSSSHAFCLCW